jgi:hypothetical protein
MWPGDDQEMNPDGYWVPGVPEPIQKETERNAMEKDRLPSQQVDPRR